MYYISINLHISCHSGYMTDVFFQFSAVFATRGQILKMFNEGIILKELTNKEDLKTPEEGPKREVKLIQRGEHEC